MTEKINQLCDQIKDLLQKNDREYIIGKIPYDIEESPEFYKSIFDTIGDEIGDFADDILCLEMDLDLQYSIHEDYGTIEGQILNAIRIKSDELVFFIEEIYNVGDGPETGCLYEESIDLQSWQSCQYFRILCGYFVWQDRICSLLGGVESLTE